MAINRNNFWANWKTTSAAVVIVLVWIIKVLVGTDIPTEVAAAITAVVASIGLMFAADAG